MPQIAQNFYLLSQVSDILFAFAMLHDELHGSNLSSELSAPFVHLRCTSQTALPLVSIACEVRANSLPNGNAATLLL